VDSPDAREAHKAIEVGDREGREALWPIRANRKGTPGPALVGCQFSRDNTVVDRVLDSLSK